MQHAGHLLIRPLAEPDVDGAREVSAAAFDDYDRRYGEPPTEVTPELVDRRRRRVRHFLTHDPQGCWVAEEDGALVGVALASRRDRLWGLSLLVVAPGTQSRGVGARLLEAALGYAQPGDEGVILSSRDPRAMHRYAAAGFDLHPQVRAKGAVKPDSVPALGSRVREGRDGDQAVGNAVDAVVRGAARGPDHTQLRSVSGAHFVVDDVDGRGYAYGLTGGGVHCLAATDEETATALLWRCIAHDVDRGVDSGVDHVNGRQQWAVRVAVRAGLSLEPAGPVFWRGRIPPAGYLPSGPYL